MGPSPVMAIMSIPHAAAFSTVSSRETIGRTANSSSRLTLQTKGPKRGPSHLLSKASQSNSSSRKDFFRLG